VRNYNRPTEDPLDGKKHYVWGKGLGACALVLLVGAPLAACGADPTSVKKDAIQVTTYRGRDLRCLVTPGSYGGPPSYDCDFEGFYANPRYEAPSSVSRIPSGTFTPVVVPYNGAELQCLVYDQGHAMVAETCDFPGRYRSPHSDHSS
jgi:hypothetical protein